MNSDGNDEANEACKHSNQLTTVNIRPFTKYLLFIEAKFTLKRFTVIYFNS